MGPESYRRFCYFHSGKLSPYSSICIKKFLRSEAQIVPSQRRKIGRRWVGLAGINIMK